MNQHFYLIKNILHNVGFSYAETVKYYKNDDSILSYFYVSNDTCVIVDISICEERGSNFSYEFYTQKQNEYMIQYPRCFRIVFDEHFEAKVTDLLNKTRVMEFSKESYSQRDILYIDNSALESEFENRFIDVYGTEALEYLYKEFGFLDFDGRQTYLDFALNTVNGYIAVEENGVNYHHPQIIKLDKYQKQLDKQNAFCYFGYKLFRFSSMDCSNRDKINENIRHYFGDITHFKQKEFVMGTRSVELYDHQKLTLSRLVEDRKNGKYNFLVVFPTAGGKSKIIEEDISSLLIQNPKLKILIVAPNIPIVNDWKKRIDTVLNNIRQTVSVSENIHNQITCASYHALWSNAFSLSPDFFDYIVIDEAHHAAAPMMRRALQYFTPKYLIGLSATPERIDFQQISSIFGEYQTPLTIEEAMESGVISKARAYRINTNLNLSEVRFNGKTYNNSDLEKVIRVSSRNELIADVIEQHFNKGEFKNLQGIIFCTSIAHTEEIETIMNSRGIPTLAVHSNKTEPIQLYSEKKIRFLASCSLISEGWDSPQTSIVVMARPTFSKTLYLQQLGRGFRRYPGKDFLYIIDVVDQYGSLAIPWTINSIFSNHFYTPFGDPTRKPTLGEFIIVNGIQEKIMSIQEININTFEKVYGDMLSSEQAARELYVGTNSLINWVKNGSVSSDLIVPFGSSKLYFFKPDSISKIRDIKNLGVHDDSTLFIDFFEFIKDKQFTYSFKIIFILSLMKNIDINGEAELSKIREDYVRFYLDRISKHLKVDRDSCIYTKDYLCNEKIVDNSILTNPFEKYERKRFIFYSKDLSRISFNQTLWSQLKVEHFIEIESTMINHLNEYYKYIDGVQDISFLRRYI
jgi:superfamily II DNA or RNA helicase